MNSKYLRAWAVSNLVVACVGCGAEPSSGDETMPIDAPEQAPADVAEGGSAQTPADGALEPGAEVEKGSDHCPNVVLESCELHIDLCKDSCSGIDFQACVHACLILSGDTLCNDCLLEHGIVLRP